jgi:hypothetical protein
MHLSQPPRRVVVWVGMLAVLFSAIGLASLAVTQAPAPSTEQAPGDPLLSLNDTSRMLYSLAKQKALAASGPVLIAEGDDLVLRNGKKRTQARVVPEIYHTLKAISHIPMALDVFLAAHEGESPLPEDMLQDLRAYRELFPAAGKRIATAGLNTKQQERQREIVERSTTFLDEVLESRQCIQARRVSFTRTMTPLVMANVADAAKAAIDMLHRQVLAWKSQMSVQEWSTICVLVTGRQLPRRDNLTVQYFAWLLRTSGENERIIYAEGLADEPRALDLLATHRVDTGIGRDFFDDSKRMKRDLLADGARDYLHFLGEPPR